MSEQISIETSARDLPSIKLVFEQTADRWNHHWSTAGADQPFLTSIEGMPDQIWPPSPPLQEISQHTLEHGDAVLGVGMAGKSYWAAAYSLEKSNQSDQTTSIQSDLSCQKKVSAQTGTIGSTYKLGLSCQVQSCTPERIEMLSDAEKVIVLEAMSGDDFATVFELTHRVLWIRPNLISNSPAVATRWGFRVQMAR